MWAKSDCAFDFVEVHRVRSGALPDEDVVDDYAVALIVRRLGMTECHGGPVISDPMSTPITYDVYRTGGSGASVRDTRFHVLKGCKTVIGFHPYVEVKASVARSR